MDVESEGEDEQGIHGNGDEVGETKKRRMLTQYLEEEETILLRGGVLGSKEEEVIPRYRPPLPRKPGMFLPSLSPPPPPQQHLPTLPF